MPSLHALGDQPVPVLYDLDIRHIPPQLAIINGALATVELTPAAATLVQRLIRGTGRHSEQASRLGDRQLPSARQRRRNSRTMSRLCHSVG